MLRIAAVGVAALVATIGLPAAVATGPTDVQRATVEIIDRDVAVDPVESGLDQGDYRWMDIRQSRRTLYRTDGVTYLRVALSSRRDFPVPKKYSGVMDWVAFHTFLDTRGDGRWDYRVLTWGYSGSPSICEVTRRGHPRAELGTPHPGVSEHGALACRIHANDLTITKPVRWRIISFTELGPGLAQDSAPVHGWYP